MPLQPITGHPEALETHYLRWRDDAPLGSLTLALSWSKGRSVEFTAARGVARLDFAQESLDLVLHDFGAREEVELWLVPFPRVGRAAKPIHAGTVALSGGTGTFELPLSGALEGFELDRIVVSEAGRGPRRHGLLVGSPGLFERLLSAESSPDRSVGGVRVVPPTRFDEDRPLGLDVLERLVAQGEEIFFGETFEGNGRDCGTCHPAENNFTLDPAFIRSLPEDDPLFVAEFLPALDARRNGGLVFENPILMRRFGLIVENLDGFEDLENRFVMRSVQHVLGLARTIEPAPRLSQPFTHLLGWSGDGSVGSGSLREFAVGAVRQHFPRTMGRALGVDFRLPTARELNALEAFLLSLGRQEELDFNQLRLSDPGAARGESVFINNACIFCHQGGGSQGTFGSIGTGDFLQDSGVEAFTQNHLDGTGERRPVDGGFGTNPQGDFSDLVPNGDGSFGERTFNSQSVIEAADTLPAFHSNLTALPHTGLSDTIEGAVEFYTSQEFEDAAFAVQLTDAEIEDTGRFLRVINALDNLRTIDEYGNRAIDRLSAPRPAFDQARRLAQLAVLECEDVLQVLGAVDLHPDARGEVARAIATFESSLRGSRRIRIGNLRAALLRIASARAALVE